MGKFVSLIPEILKTKDMTAKALERKAKLSWPTAWQLSVGEIPATTRTLGKLCAAFECQPNDLILWNPGE